MQTMTVVNFHNNFKRLTYVRVPLAKPVPPEDVAKTIVFLASERYSGSVHGQLIPIDAGKTGNLIRTWEESLKRT